MGFISTATMQFSYFSSILPEYDWSDKKVLDFGGNIGNILTDPKCTIKEENYTCLDVSKDAIVMGQFRYPKARFIFYNCYNFSFNPGGILDLPIPDLSDKFDVIISYSIFTHTSKSEMLAKVIQLSDLLNENGRIVFTYIDPTYNPHHFNSNYQNVSNIEKRLRRLNNGFLNKEIFEKAKSANWSLLLNKDELLVESEDHSFNELDDSATYFSFFKTEFMKIIFPKAQLLLPPLNAYPENYIAELQHSCLIEKI